MAQQQMLLLMLAVIIIGVAVMTGSDQFEKDLNAAVQDEMKKVILDIAARAQVWYHRPAAQYGGERSFSEFSLEKIHADAYGALGDIKLINKQPDSFRLIGSVPGDSGWRVIVDVYPNSLSVAQAGVAAAYGHVPLSAAEAFGGQQ
jgi:hypothetical protein